MGIFASRRVANLPFLPPLFNVSMRNLPLPPSSACLQFSEVVRQTQSQSAFLWHQKHHKTEYNTRVRICFGYEYTESQARRYNPLQGGADFQFHPQRGEGLTIFANFCRLFRPFLSKSTQKSPQRSGGAGSGCTSHPPPISTSLLPVVNSLFIFANYRANIELSKQRSFIL